MTDFTFIDQVKKYVASGWPIEPINCANLFEDQSEIDKWLATVPDHLKDRVQNRGGGGFHPIKLLMLLDPKKFWTDEKLASQTWDRGVGFRAGLTLIPSDSKPGKVQLTIAIDGDSHNPQVIKTLERVIQEYSLEDSIPIQHTPHGGLHLLLCAYVDPNNLEEIELWERKRSLVEGAGAWLQGAKCAIKINCQQVTLYPSKHRNNDGTSYKLNKVIPLTNTAWILDKVVKAFIEDGLLECTPEEYHKKLDEKANLDSASFKEFDSSEWFELTDDEITRACDLILGTDGDGEEFGPIYYDGVRHTNTMPIAGACAWSHILQESTERLFQVLCDRVEDDELEDRLNITRETYQRIQVNQAVQGRQVLTELFRGAHKSKEFGAAVNRYEQFREALGLNHKTIKKSLDVAGFLKASHGEHVRVHDIMISGTQEAEKMVTKITCTCIHCTEKWEPKQYNTRPLFGWEINDIIHRAEKSRCPNCKEHEAEVDSEEINAVQVEIQDCSLTSDSQQTTAMAVLMNQASYDVRTNEECVITGFINTVPKKGKRVLQLFAGDARDMGSGITYAKNYFSNKLTPEDEAECAKFIQEHGENVLVELAKLFKISVLDYQYEKEGILLACANATKDSTQRRTRINVLLVGDRGLAKSKLLRGATEVVPKSRYISGTTTSVKTAICVVVRDIGGVEVTRPGPIVKASGAVCAIDELGTISYEDQKYFLSAVEEGLIPFGKWGLTKDLDGSATFIFSANPSGSSGTWGEYQPDKRAQIPVYGPLLDRIDLVFITKMNREEGHLHSYSYRDLRNKERSEDIDVKEAENHLFITKLLLYCKRFNPELSDDVLLMVENFYVSVAKNPVSQASPRLLNTLYNSVKALARLKGKVIADTSDAKQIIEFFRKQFEIKAQLKTEIPEEPIEIVKKVIITRIEGFEGHYFLPELLQNLYNEEPDVRAYFGDKLVLNKGTNRKYRSIVEWVEGEPKIKLLDKGKLKIAWEASYKNSRGGKRDGCGRPSDENQTNSNAASTENDQTTEPADTKESNNHSEKSNNHSEEIKLTLKLTSNNQTHAQADILGFGVEDYNSFGKDISQNPKNPMSACQPEHKFDYSTEQSSIPISEPILAKPVDIEPITRPVASNPILVTQVPELANLVFFDMEWFNEGKQENIDLGRAGVIYCFCSVDTKGHKEILHIAQFGNSHYDFMVAVLEVLTRYDSIAGYNILKEESKNLKGSYDSDWAKLRSNCAKAGLSSQFEALHDKVKLLDLCRVFTNKALRSALEATGIKFKGDSLGAVAKAYVNQTKMNGIKGDTVETLPPGKQLEYCFKDTELTLLLASKNNYEVLELVYGVAQDIKSDFFKTANAFGPTEWWRYKLDAENYPKYHTDMEWMKSQLFTNGDGKRDTLFKFEGGYVQDPVPGIHKNVYTYDFVSLYPSVCIVFKISSEMINCDCCKDAFIPQAVQDEVDASAKGKRNWEHYRICRKQDTGILSELMRKLLAEKDSFKQQGNIFASKAKKLIMNSGYGAFGYVNFAYFDPRICEIITAYGRHLIKEISKLLDNDPSTQLLYNDTDSIFVKGKGSFDLSAEAMNRFGIRLALDKTWKILFMFDEKKQYFGLTMDGKLETKTLTGMKDDKTKFCNDATDNLIRKELVEMFIDNPQEGLKQAIDYVKSAFLKLEDRAGDLDFIINELSKTETAKKPLYDYADNDWHTRAYNEILEDCNGNEELAKSRSQGDKEYTYWKIVQTIHTKTKTGKDSIREKGSTTIYPEKHVVDVNIKKYKEELWTAFGPILQVYGLGKNELESLKKELF